MQKTLKRHGMRAAMQHTNGSLQDTYYNVRNKLDTILSPQPNFGGPHSVPIKPPSAPDWPYLDNYTSQPITSHKQRMTVNLFESRTSSPSPVRYHEIARRPHHDRRDSEPSLSYRVSTWSSDADYSDSSRYSHELDRMESEAMGIRSSRNVEQLKTVKVKMQHLEGERFRDLDVRERAKRDEELYRKKFELERLKERILYGDGESVSDDESGPTYQRYGAREEAAALKQRATKAAAHGTAKRAGHGHTTRKKEREIERRRRPLLSNELVTKGPESRFDHRSHSDSEVDIVHPPPPKSGWRYVQADRTRGLLDDEVLVSPAYSPVDQHRFRSTRSVVEDENVDDLLRAWTTIYEVER
jgi:hypothetical protein